MEFGDFAYELELGILLDCLGGFDVIAIGLVFGMDTNCSSEKIMLCQTKVCQEACYVSLKLSLVVLL